MTTARVCEISNQTTTIGCRKMAVGALSLTSPLAATTATPLWSVESVRMPVEPKPIEEVFKPSAAKIIAENEELVRKLQKLKVYTSVLRDSEQRTALLVQGVVGDVGSRGVEALVRGANVLGGGEDIDDSLVNKLLPETLRTSVAEKVKSVVSKTLKEMQLSSSDITQWFPSEEISRLLEDEAAADGRILNASSGYRPSADFLAKLQKIVAHLNASPTSIANDIGIQNPLTNPFSQMASEPTEIVEKLRYGILSYNDEHMNALIRQMVGDILSKNTKREINSSMDKWLRFFGAFEATVCKVGAGDAWLQSSKVLNDRKTYLPFVQAGEDESKADIVKAVTRQFLNKEKAQTNSSSIFGPSAINLIDEELTVNHKELKSNVLANERNVYLKEVAVAAFYKSAETHHRLPVTQQQLVLAASEGSESSMLTRWLNERRINRDELKRLPTLEITNQKEFLVDNKKAKTIERPSTAEETDRRLIAIREGLRRHEERRSSDTASSVSDGTI